MDAVLNALDLLWPVRLLPLVLAAAVTLLYAKLSATEIFRRYGFIAMFAFFGATIGTFLGGSEEAEFSAILNALVTLASGYIAYVTSKDLPEEIKVLVPGALTCLLVSILFSNFYIRFFLHPPSV